MASKTRHVRVKLAKDAFSGIQENIDAEILKTRAAKNKAAILAAYAIGKSLGVVVHIPPGFYDWL
jgi:hypothetical protein